MGPYLAGHNAISFSLFQDTSDNINTVAVTVNYKLNSTAQRGILSAASRPSALSTELAHYLAIVLTQPIALTFLPAAIDDRLQRGNLAEKGLFVVIE